MTDTEYKKKSLLPNAFSRELIEQTIALVVEPKITTHLKNILAEKPIEKPPLHGGRSKDDIFLVSLSKDKVDQILVLLQTKEARIAEASVVNQKDLSAVVFLVDRWSKLLAKLMTSEA